MISLTNTTKAKLEAALDRAIAENLEVTQTLGGSSIYQVRSGHSGHNVYTVIFEKSNGNMKADCNCHAGKNRFMCKHIAAACIAYKTDLLDKQAAKAALEPATAPQEPYESEEYKRSIEQDREDLFG